MNGIYGLSIPLRKSFQDSMIIWFHSPSTCEDLTAICFSWPLYISEVLPVHANAPENSNNTNDNIDRNNNNNNNPPKISNDNNNNDLTGASSTGSPRISSYRSRSNTFPRSYNNNKKENKISIIDTAQQLPILNWAYTYPQ